MNTLQALAAALLSTVALAANGSSTFHPSNDEPGTENHVSPGTLSKAEAAERERSEAARRDPNWVYAGEEAGWELRPHAFELRGGRILHADDFAHDTPQPAIPSEAELQRNPRDAG